jgi:hypothetical protein
VDQETGKKKMSFNSFHTRIGDPAVSFGMVRYCDGANAENEDAFWRCVISRHCGINRLAAFEVSIKDLIEIEEFYDRAIDTVKSDGERAPIPAT